ncbi:MAG: hypothetical protein JXA99_09615 [Candidatus Lokiarchaeota archaeon]|nr:hypothetical protein [Candidatus Lokiarchaeota archaeon]
MNNDRNINYDESKTIPIDLTEKLDESNLKNKAEIKELFSNLKTNPNTSEIFFNFLDSMFDLGIKILNNVNLDLILDKIEELMKKEK